MIEARLDAKEVDILLLAEGTYPFVKGGVAQWIYDLILNLPEYRFGIIFLGAYEGLYENYEYPIPKNVIHLQIVYLFNEEAKGLAPVVLKEKENKKALDKIIKIHEVFKSSHGCPHALSEGISDIGYLLDDLHGFTYSQFLHSKDAWAFISEQYLAHSTDPSFIDYFWNIRNMHMPLWELEKVLDAAPVTSIIHTISTGYAGLLASMMKQRFGYPLILSEHGIYTKERNIELLQSTMLIHVDILITSKKMFSYQHQLWLKFFDSLARCCYSAANLITSLFSLARQQQILGGAEAYKTQITPNGVDISKFSLLRRTQGPIPKIVGFVGRCVRIKDIKMFIRAVGIMATKDPEIIAWIRLVGEGDKDYLQECLDYINLMDLKNKIVFINEGTMHDILAQIGLLALTSISEGMPLVLLEALAAGIPIIATDVGACREIIEGRGNDEDQAIGHCGSVAAIGDATGIAQAAVQLLNDEGAWFAAQQAGIKRIEHYYTQDMMIETYQRIYEQVKKTGNEL